METRCVRALVAKTEFVAGYGMVTFDPDSKRKELREPAVPVPAIPTLVERGYIADDLAPEPEPEPEPQAGSEDDDGPAAPATPKPAGRKRAAATPVAEADAPPV